MSRSRRCRAAWATVAAGLILFYPSVVLCEQESVIKLKDGMVLRGEVLSKDGDFYKIKTDILGVLIVRESDVAAIENVPGAATNADPLSRVSGSGAGVPSFQASEPSALSSPQAQAYQRKIMSDPRIMSKVEDLAQDKELLEILSDEDLKAAIMRQDLKYLQENEKFMKLLESSTVKDIVNDIVEESEE